MTVWMGVVSCWPGIVVGVVGVRCSSSGGSGSGSSSRWSKGSATTVVRWKALEQGGFKGEMTYTHASHAPATF